MNETVCIVTPVYNRRNRMPKLFQSLLEQTIKDFYWLIIDDGSTDGVEDDIEDYINKADFRIEYHKKNNGGKHTALNMAFKLTNSELTFIVDSDDYILNDAVEAIVEKWLNIGKRRDICSIIFLKGFNKSTPIGDQFKKDNIFANDIEVRDKHKVRGDKAEVFVTQHLKKYQFPVFEGEKFQGENYVWWQLSFEHDSYYVNKIIYIGEYLDDGLTKAGRALRLSCPKGGMENSKIGLDKRFSFKMRMKRALLYVCYARFDKQNIMYMIKNSGHPFLILVGFIPGNMLYYYWKHTVKGIN